MEEKICLHDLLEMGAGREGRLCQVVFYRTGGETGDWVWRRGGRSEDLQLAPPAGVLLHVLAAASLSSSRWAQGVMAGSPSESV